VPVILVAAFRTRYVQFSEELHRILSTFMRTLISLWDVLTMDIDRYSLIIAHSQSVVPPAAIPMTGRFVDEFVSFKAHFGLR
jgi:hypothetical protein